MIALDLLAALTALRGGDAYSTPDHAAHTIPKHSGIRVVLHSLKAGGRRNENHAGAPIAVHGLQGTVNFTAGDQPIRLTPTVLVTVAAGLLHSVEASEESVFLLPMAPIAPQADANLGHHG